jgi:hypothetical protein
MPCTLKSKFLFPVHRNASGGIFFKYCKHPYKKTSDLTLKDSLTDQVLNLFLNDHEFESFQGNWRLT